MPWAATARPAEICAGALDAVVPGQIEIVLVGDTPLILAEYGGEAAARHHRPARAGADRVQRGATGRRARQAGVVARRHRGLRPRGLGAGGGVGRLDRCPDGRLHLLDAPHPRRPPARPGGRAPRHRRPADADRLRRQRRSSARDAGAVRAHGRVLRRGRARPPRAARRPAVDRRGARQGQPADEGGLRAARRRARPRLRGQHRGPRPAAEQGAGGRHRRVHRQRRAEDGRGHRDSRSSSSSRPRRTATR